MTDPSLEESCEQTSNGTKNNETWWGGETRPSVMWYKWCTYKHWKKPMGRLGIGEEKFHIGTMYIGIDKFDNIEFNKTSVANK